MNANSSGWSNHGIGTLKKKSTHIALNEIGSEAGNLSATSSNDLLQNRASKKESVAPQLCENGEVRRDLETAHTPSDPCKNTLSVPSLPDSHQTAEVDTAEMHTYGQILKSSTWIGSSSLLNILIGIVRTKAMAVLLGPAGFGLMGLYGSIADFALMIAGLGINNSGVRQIAEAVGTGDTKRIARTVVVLRKTSIILGILGTVLLAVFSRQVSTFTFGSDQNAAAVLLLSLVVFFRMVSDNQGALIQGLRRISDLAKMGVLGTFLGMVISIPFVYFLREKGVVPSLVAFAVIGNIVSFMYSRKVQIQPPLMTMSQVRTELDSLLKLGFAFMASGCIV